MANVTQTYTSQMKTVDALWTLIQEQAQSVKDILYSRMKAEEEAKQSAQERYVRESLERAFAELEDAKQSGRELPGARSLIAQLQK